MTIHPTAVISPEAEIDPTAEIGPYVVIDGPVRIGARTRLCPHAVVLGETDLGEDTVVHPGAVLGDLPQDLAYRETRSYLRIGHRNVFREHATVHRGTTPESATVIGDDGYFMQNAHVAHNCRVGNRVIVAGGALLAGHVEVGDGAFVSGNCVVHQFVRLGRFAILRGLSRTSRDVPPFCIMDGTHTVRGVNVQGLRRAGFEPEQIRRLRLAYRRLFHRPVDLGRALDQIETEIGGPEIGELVAFIRASQRGVALAPRRTAGSTDDEPL